MVPSSILGKEELRCVWLKSTRSWKCPFHIKPVDHILSLSTVVHSSAFQEQSWTAYYMFNTTELQILKRQQRSHCETSLILAEQPPFYEVFPHMVFLISRSFTLLHKQPFEMVLPGNEHYVWPGLKTGLWGLPWAPALGGTVRDSLDLKERSGPGWSFLSSQATKNPRCCFAHPSTRTRSTHTGTTRQPDSPIPRRNTRVESKFKTLSLLIIST